MLAIPSLTRYIPYVMEDIIRTVDLALESRGISARAASIRAQGAPELIRDMRRGHVPSVVRLRALCEVLGLEFYVGPPRWRRVEEIGALPDVPLQALERASQDLAQLTAFIGGNPISESLWPILVARRASELPGAEQDSAAEAGSLDASTLVPDAPEGGAEGLRSQNWISRGWLEGHGLDAAHCAMVRMRDGSMEPTLPIGCAVLVDSASTAWEAGCVVAVQLGEEIVLRRAAVAADGARYLVCDHPDRPDEPWLAGAKVVGRVRWLGRWLDSMGEAGQSGQVGPEHNE